MKQAKFSADGKKYEMAYDCPDEEINNQINEIFSEKCYKLAKRKKNMVVLDIGANVGMFSLFIKPYARKIYAVEPSRRIFECLKENTKDWDNIEIFNVAFLHHIGKEQIYSKSSDIPPQSFMEKGNYQETTNVTTIEQFFKDNSKVCLIEGNFHGQLGEMISHKTGLTFHKKFLRYDGRPFNMEQVLTFDV